MNKQPKLKAKVSAQDFKTWLAEEAESFALWIDLNVTAFPADAAARRERIEAVNDDDGGFQFFLETYLPHYVKGDHSLFHQKIFERVPEILASEKGVRDLFIAPRGSSKSTHLSLGFALYCIVRGLKRYILEICDVYEQAALLVEAIKAELTGNPRLKFDFPEVFGAGRVWREGKIVTRNKIRVEGVGAGQKVRGRRHGPHRPDLVFLDDLENDENVLSPDQRKKLQTWVNRALLKVGPPDGSMDVIWVGTVLHYDAVLVRAAKSPSWRVEEFQAIVEWPDDMDLWDMFDEIYNNDGEVAAQAFYDDNKAAMDKGAVVNWPSMQPLIFLMFERAASNDAFQSEYQNKPISDGNPFAKLVYWAVPVPNLVKFGAVDPSLGKKGKGRDPSAILVGGYDRMTGKLDLIEASIRKRLPDIIISDVIQMQKDHQALLWFVESVQFQEFFRTTAMAQAAKQGIALPCAPVIPHTDKDLRIERLQPPVAAGLIRFDANHTTLIEQLQQWPNADHDDGPDTLEMLWQNALFYGGGLAGGSSGVQASNDQNNALKGY
ncbi:phage terminase large subunit [uncultured Tateyamaria sp.]|uniref:phage terminase large subunit n=1 Tax=uncultured Tateyamaria sp. TaxID=455651 RepID=UPI0026139191|nr:phage terminase large subunit [uncultured Tateyamaria sp.]